RDEMLQVLLALEGACEFAGTTENRSLLARCRRSTHQRRLQGTWAMFGKMVGLGILRPLLQDHFQDLRDDITGTLDHHGVAEAHAEAPYFVGVVQSRVLHDNTADRHRLELGDRRQRAGAPDLDLDSLDDRGRFLRRKLVRNSPARVARDESEALLPI